VATFLLVATWGVLSSLSLASSDSSFAMGLALPGAIFYFFVSSSPAAWPLTIF